MRKDNTAAITTVVVLGASAVALVYRMYRRFLQRKPNSQLLLEWLVQDSDIETTQLTSVESKMLSAGFTPIATLTWFDGNPEEAASILQKRVQAVVEQNPWLAGRLIQQSDKAFLVYSPIVNAEKARKMFCHFREPIESVHRRTPIAEIAKTLTEASVLLRAGCDTKQQLWKVVVLPSSKAPSCRFAVIVCLSHVVGDGHTFYELYNSLMDEGSNKIPRLVPRRIPTTIEQQKKALGKAEFGIFGMPGFIFTILRGLFMSKVLAPIGFNRQWQVESHYFELDKHEIQQIKDSIKQGDSRVPFVSTNDILTSWFFLNSDCQHGRMAINFRNRLEGHQDIHAGNYESVLHYRVPQDASSPAFIRMSLFHLKRAVTKSEPIRNSELAKANLSLISNWATFKKATEETCLTAINCEEQLHVPLFDVVSLMPSTLAICIVFQARPDRLGLMVAGSSERLSELLEAPFLAERLC